MTTLLDKISDEEMKLIEAFRRIDEDNSDFCIGSFLPNEQWLCYWNSEKEWMGSVFKDSLILKKKIISTIQDGELENSINSLIYDENTKVFINKLVAAVKEYNPDTNISSEWYYDASNSVSYLIRRDLISPISFIENTYNGNTFEVKVPGDKTFKVVKGCKVIKTIGKLSALFNLSDDFEPIRLRHSQIMNQAKIQANLCISIHPLDYITASYNSNKWRSCMHWEDGEYRHGVIEMMNSPWVVVAYLESNHEYVSFGKYTWNSKKWREFFIVHPQCISGIKGYPYWNRDLEDATISWLRELFKDIYDYSEKIIPWQVGMTIVDNSVNSSLRVDFDCGPSMYNDFYGSNVYHTCLRKNLSIESYRSINYSGPDECVYCGSTHGNYDNESDIYCDDCIEHYSCCSCGESIRDRRDLIEFNGRYYCYACYENLPCCTACESIIDTNFEDDSFSFIIGPKEELLNELGARNIDFEDHEDAFITEEYNNSFCWCVDCMNKYFKRGEEESWHNDNRYYVKYGWYRTVPIVPIDRMSAAGLKILQQEDVDRLTQLTINDFYS